METDFFTGLGMVGVGVYGFAGALVDDTRFFWVTVGLRAAFTGVMLSVGESWGVVGYEALTAGMAGLAAVEWESLRFADL